MNIEEFRELNAPYKELKAFYEDLPYHKTQAMRNGALKKTMDILNSEKMTNQKFNRLVKYRGHSDVCWYLLPFWLYALIRYERLYFKLNNLGSREKRVKVLVDLILSREDLSFDVELISSATFACRRSKCFYSTYRLASVDPWCGSERDDTIRMTCYVAGKSIKGTEMAISILEQIPDIGKSLDYPSEDNGFTALHYACAYSNPVLVKQLLEKGANINSCDDAGHTPIWHCVAGVQPGIKVESYPRSNAIELIELLLDNGADPNLLDNKGVKFLKYLRKTNRFRGGGFKNIVNKIKSLS